MVGRKKTSVYDCLNVLCASSKLRLRGIIDALHESNRLILYFFEIFPELARATDEDYFMFSFNKQVDLCKDAIGIGEGNGLFKNGITPLSLVAFLFENIIIISTNREHF